MSGRHVSGALFVDYVQMIRSRKDVAWGSLLGEEDLTYLTGQISVDEWYPMETFERLGNAILAEVANDNLDAARLWGRLSVGKLHNLHPEMIAERDPVESLMRVQVLRSTFFDFEAFRTIMAVPGSAHIAINYYMGARAEEAAAYQAMGFFEGVLERSGAAEIHAAFRERAWANDARTLLELAWDGDH